MSPRTHTRRSAPNETIVFLGPSLPIDEAQSLLRARYLPPARQGDVFEALSCRPRMIVLVDGVFEAQPSVWHHEVLAALDAGVPVLGASSMGALRAAELQPHGMQGIGTIFGWYRDGVISDDAEVALLHADADHAHRPLTVPLVNVRYAAERAVKAQVLTAADARRVIACAVGCFYQARTWPAVLAKLRWPDEKRERLSTWLRRTDTDLKAKDARACLRKAAALLRRKASPGVVAARPHQGSRLVRMRRLHASAPLLQRLASHRDASEMIDAGLRRALLADLARTRGLQVTTKALEQERAALLARHARSAADQERFLLDSGLDEGQLRKLLEDVLLERLMIQHAARMQPDGPTVEEALAAEARLRGIWAQVIRKMPRR